MFEVLLALFLFSLGLLPILQQQIFLQKQVTDQQLAEQAQQILENYCQSRILLSPFRWENAIFHLQEGEMPHLQWQNSQGLQERIYPCP